MRIVEQKYSLSEEDLVYLQGSPVLIKMLKQRLVVEFENNPNIEEIDFSGARGFCLIKSLGHKIYEFWLNICNCYNQICKECIERMQKTIIERIEE